MDAKKNNRRRYRKPRFEDSYPRNNRITAKEVRLVGEGVKVGIYPIAKALEMARAAELDLVQISNKGDYPICKIIDFYVFKFQQKKAKKAIVKANKSLQNQVKLSPNMGEHDLKVREKRAIGFLEKKITVKVLMEFRRGRPFFRYKEEGRACLQAFINTLEACGAHIKQNIKEENRRMAAIIDPGTIKNKN